jgi:hypothetical protein
VFSGDLDSSKDFLVECQEVDQINLISLAESNFIYVPLEKKGVQQVFEDREPTK